MRPRRDQEEILKLHRIRRRPRAELDALALAEEEGCRVPQLHAGEMDADAGPGADTEGVESRFGIRGGGFGGAFLRGDPPVRVEARGSALVDWGKVWGNKGTKGCEDNRELT